MGWEFGLGDTRADVIRGRVAGWPGTMVLKHACSGNVLWTVNETARDGTTERWIGCTLLASAQGLGWGSKEMGEAWGPAALGCPLAFFALVPEPPNELAREWRAQVRAYHAERRRGRAPAQGYDARSLTTQGQRAGVAEHASEMAAGPEVEQVIRDVIERTNLAQAVAIGSGDQSVLAATTTERYFPELTRINQRMLDDGVVAIRMVNAEWGPVAVDPRGTTATATTYETWRTTFADGAADEARGRNDYRLVRHRTGWRIDAVELPSDAPRSMEERSPGPPGPPRPPATPANQTSPEPGLAVGSSPPGRDTEVAAANSPATKPRRRPRAAARSAGPQPVGRFLIERGPLRGWWAVIDTECTQCAHHLDSWWRTRRAARLQAAFLSQALEQCRAQYGRIAETVWHHSWRGVYDAGVRTDPPPSGTVRVMSVKGWVDVEAEALQRDLLRQAINLWAVRHRPISQIASDLGLPRGTVVQVIRETGVRRYPWPATLRGAAPMQ